MSKFIDMTGWKMSEHGIPESRLTILKRVDNDKNGKAQWLCKCECGNILTIKGTNLRNGNTKSCGCLNKDKMSQRMINKHQEYRKQNIIGKTFGKLTVIKSLNKINASGHMIYLCQCECGNYCERAGNNLQTKNYIPSCGHHTSSSQAKIAKMLTEGNIIFETEKVFDTCIFADTQRKARFDFYIPQSNYIIEYDGEQHFEPRRFKGVSEEEARIQFKITQEHDKIKNQWCKENNIPLIRIPYTHFQELVLDDLKLDTSQYRIC